MPILIRGGLPPGAVMHESSRRVAETLQEIYSPEWDGHGELKAIADVSPKTRPGVPLEHRAGGELGCFTPFLPLCPPEQRPAVGGL